MPHLELCELMHRRAVFEGYEPVQLAITNTGRIFTVQKFQQLVDVFESDGALADKQAVRDGVGVLVKRTSDPRMSCPP